MITIKVKAITIGAFRRIEQHFKECNRISNRIKLKANGVTQILLKEQYTLEIQYNTLLTKLQDKLLKIDSKLDNFKHILKEDQKEDFIKEVDSFMLKGNITRNDYEVIFEDDTTE